MREAIGSEMIDYIVAAQVSPDMIILLPWPDWAWRRFTVLTVTKRNGVVYMGVRPYEGEDQAIVWRIARLSAEPLHLVTKTTQSPWAPSLKKDHGMKDQKIREVK